MGGTAKAGGESVRAASGTALVSGPLPALFIFDFFFALAALITVIGARVPCRSLTLHEWNMLMRRYGRNPQISPRGRHQERSADFPIRSNVKKRGLQNFSEPWNLPELLRTGKSS